MEQAKRVQLGGQPQHGVYRDVTPQQRVAFLLLPTFSMLACVAAVEPLRVANRLRSAALYDWRFVSLDGAPVVASNGMSLAADTRLESATAADLVIVCGPFDPSGFDERAVLSWLRHAAARGAALAGIETGAYVLAAAGLLSGQRATVHFETREAFLARFEDVRLSDEIYEIGERRYTCAGGSAALDMMLHVVGLRHGAAFAAQIAEVLIHERIRAASSPQRMDLRVRTGIANPVILAALELMEANLEQPLSTHELAAYVGVSRRQLERLFRRYLDITPSRHYMNLRLKRGRDLLQQTRLSVMEVALACGFSSAGHFSHRYRQQFGHPPRSDRAPATG